MSSLVALIFAAQALAASAALVALGRPGAYERTCDCLGLGGVLCCLGRECGHAVAAVWIVLLLGKGTRHCSGWIETLGVAVGVGWIVLSFEGVWTTLAGVAYGEL